MGPILGPLTKDNIFDHCMPEPNSGCWLWTKALFPSGYALKNRLEDGKQKAKKGHRLVYELLVRSIPKGMSVCHRCDTPSCVNPAHLFLGTHRENIDDMMAKGRQQKGHAHCHAKLTDRLAREIFDLANNTTMLFKEIGNLYDVSESRVSRIKTGHAWAWATTAN